MPVLAPSDEIENHPAFANAEEKLVPDVATYSAWFSRTDDRRRKVAVGARRYNTLHNALGHKPEWAHFLDPKTGDLLSHAKLKAETPQQRRERVTKIRVMLAQRERLTRQVSGLGFVRE